MLVESKVICKDNPTFDKFGPKSPLKVDFATNDPLLQAGLTAQILLGTVRYALRLRDTLTEPGVA